MPAGLVFREGRVGEAFEDTNPILLHTVRGKNAQPFRFKLSKAQKKLRDKIYKKRSMVGNLYKKYGGKVSFSNFAKPRTQVDGAWKQWDVYKRLEEKVRVESA